MPSSSSFSVSRSSCFVQRLRDGGRAALWVAVLWSLVPQRSARAEDSLTYKFQRWQEDNGRVRVDAHYAQAETTLSSDTKLKLVGVIDTISGATPTGQPAAPGDSQVPLSALTDRREAWQFEATQPFSRVTLSAGVGRSKESDYLSDVWSLNTQWNFNEKNTTLLAGYSQANDDITARFLTEIRHKQSDDAIVGLTQVLNASTVLTANLSYGQSAGYLSDPYKIIQKNTEVLPGFFLDLTFPENRPEFKEKWIGYVGVNHAVERLRGALEASYRLYDDTYGITSHTVELAWFQRLGEKVVLRPSVRFYQQSAADFYQVTWDNAAISPSDPASGRAPFYSSDYRLSAMRTWMLGLKVVWDVAPWCTVDATVERYLVDGRDHVTPTSAYTDANVFTVGIKLWR